MSETITVEAARELVFSGLKRMPAEEVALLEALGRVLAEDMTSDIDVAPFDNSAMDGFAVRAADLAGASAETPVELDVIAHIAAGDAPSTSSVGRRPGRPHHDRRTGARGRRQHRDGGAHPRRRPATAARAPASHSRSSRSSASTSVAAARRSRRAMWCSRRARSSGPRRSGCSPRPATRPSPSSRARAWRSSPPAASSSRSPRSPGPGKIRNSNSYSIAAQVLAAGAIPVRFPIVPDDVDATREAFERAAEECDYILTSGGVSVGDFDYVKPVLEETRRADLLQGRDAPRQPADPRLDQRRAVLRAAGQSHEHLRRASRSSCARRCAR